mmetsp:Transcript_111157/g.314623  ORF Transcript_111157/g.314623 Transcript_111157/m.314623 type:complete len:271 (-) Transcript_111157:3-815(-)
MELTKTVPTKPASGMNAYVPSLKSAISVSSELLISYPKPNVLMVHGSLPSFWAAFFFKLDMTTSLSSVSPSVRTIMWAKRPSRRLACIASKPFAIPAHSCVPFPKPRDSSFSSAWRCPSLSMNLKADSTLACLQKDTTASRSWTPRLRMIVLTACFATSSIDRPLLSDFPLAPCTTASMVIDQETSTTIMMSDGVRAVPSGGLIDTSTGTVESSPSCPGVIETWMVPPPSPVSSAPAWPVWPRSTTMVVPVPSRGFPTVGQLHAQNIDMA